VALSRKELLLGAIVGSLICLCGWLVYKSLKDEFFTKALGVGGFGAVILVVFYWFAHDVIGSKTMASKPPETEGSHGATQWTLRLLITVFGAICLALVVAWVLQQLIQPRFHSVDLLLKDGEQVIDRPFEVFYSFPGLAMDNAPVTGQHGRHVIPSVPAFDKFINVNWIKGIEDYEAERVGELPIDGAGHVCVPVVRVSNVDDDDSETYEQLLDRAQSCSRRDPDHSPPPNPPECVRIDVSTTSPQPVKLLLFNCSKQLQPLELDQWLRINVPGHTKNMPAWPFNHFKSGSGWHVAFVGSKTKPFSVVGVWNIYQYRCGCIQIDATSNPKKPFKAEYLSQEKEK
jgi:hypothetical protein